MYGKHVKPPAPHLMDRLNEITSGRFEDALGELKTAEASEIEARYKELQATKGAAV
jgi:hypothetical protein